MIGREPKELQQLVILSPKSFSNLLRDAKHLKVADFGLSLPTTYDSDNASSGNIGSGRSNGSAHLKPKGTSCKQFHILIQFQKYAS